METESPGLLTSQAGFLFVCTCASTHARVCVYVYVCVVWIPVCKHDCSDQMTTSGVVPQTSSASFVFSFETRLLTGGPMIYRDPFVCISLVLGFQAFAILPSLFIYLFILNMDPRDWTWVNRWSYPSTLRIVLTTEVQNKNWCKARETMILHMLHDICMIYYWDYISSPPVSYICVYELDDSKRAALHTYIDRTWHGWWKLVLESKAKDLGNQRKLHTWRASYCFPSHRSCALVPVTRQWQEVLDGLGWPRADVKEVGFH